jgi:hypothetical protein
MPKFRTRKTEGRPDETERTPARGSFEQSEGRTLLNTPRPKRKPAMHCPLHGDIRNDDAVLCPECGRPLTALPF